MRTSLCMSMRSASNPSCISTLQFFIVRIRRICKLISKFLHLLHSMFQTTIPKLSLSSLRSFCTNQRTWMNLHPLIRLPLVTVSETLFLLISATEQDIIFLWQDHFLKRRRRPTLHLLPSQSSTWIQTISFLSTPSKPLLLIALTF